jgi:hypothetical protein
MAGLEFFQRTAERVAQCRLQLRVVVLLLDELIHAQRLADDLVPRKVAAALHFPADELFLMRCEQNFHGGKLKAASSGVKKFVAEHRRCGIFVAEEIYFPKAPSERHRRDMPLRRSWRRDGFRFLQGCRA